MKILFFPRHEVSFRKMLTQCEHIRKRPPYNPVVVIAQRQRQNWVDDCAAANIEYLDVSPEVPDDPFPGSSIESGKSVGALTLLLSDLVRFFTVSRRLPRHRRFWNRLLRREAPIAVMMPGDRELGFVPSVLRAAADLSIPSIICTSSVPGTDSVAANRRGFRRFMIESQGAPLLNRLVAKLLPNQVASTIHGKMLFSPGWLTLALWTYKMLPANPWIQGGGNSRAILVDGTRKRDTFISLGAPPDKLHVIGDVDLDALYDRYHARASNRAKLSAKYDLTHERSLVSFAVPIYAEHNYMSWNAHLAALKGYADVLAAADVDVLLSFHPKSDRTQYQPLFAAYPFRAADERLLELVPASDLLVCGNSSVQEWAVLCRIPAINLDYAGIDERSFDDVSTIARVHTPESFAAALARLLNAQDSLAPILDVNATDFARFDGRSGERFRAFIDALVQRPPSVGRNCLRWNQ